MLDGSLGADRVMVTEKEDLKEEVAAMTRGVGGDIVFEASGSEAGINQAIDIVRRNGIITMIGILPKKTLANPFQCRGQAGKPLRNEVLHAD